jgi:hypothetical protein
MLIMQLLHIAQENKFKVGHAKYAKMYLHWQMWHISITQKQKLSGLLDMIKIVEPLYSPIDAQNKLLIILKM